MGMKIQLHNDFTRPANLLRRSLTALLLTLLLLPAQSMAQADLPTDEKARELVSLAKKYFRNNNYLDAALTFELATQRPQNPLSSFSQYMVGLSYFNMKEMEKAQVAFTRMVKNYPASKYVPEARYHTALTYMDSKRTSMRERGLDQMFKLMDQTQDRQFAKEIEGTIRHYLFNEYDPLFLDLYYVFAQEAYKPWFVEAICTQYDRNGEGYMVLDKLKDYEAKGGLLTDFLAGMKAKYESGKKVNTNRLNVAVFLSFHLELMDTATVVPRRSQRALELLEGMMLALDSIGHDLDKQINVKIYDTKGDTFTTRQHLNELARFQPDVVIGDIRTPLAFLISDWAEKHQVLCFVPRNSLNEVINRKQYTFLTHPSLRTHGAALARFAGEVQQMRKILVFNDNTFYSKRFARAFLRAADSVPGLLAVEKVIPADYEYNRENLPKYIRGLKASGYDGVYIPLSSEEAAGLIISQLKYHKVNTRVLGGPDWEIFSVIDPELKSTYQLEYSTFYHEKNDSVSYDVLYDACLRQYGYQPSKYTITGFDIMAYLLEMSTKMNGFTSAVDVIRQAPVYHGIHQDFWFGQNQDNQKVNIVKFEDGRIDKINWDSAQQGAVRDGMPGDPGGR